MLHKSVVFRLLPTRGGFTRMYEGKTYPPSFRKSVLHKAQKLWWPTHTETPLILEHFVQQTLIKNVQCRLVESSVCCSWHWKMLELYTALTPQSGASLPMKAQGAHSYNWVLTGVTGETEQNKYVNKVVFWIPKGEEKGLHLSLFKNDYPMTIPPKLKWSFFSLRVNKWQEWDLQPGFSVSQFSSTNH